MQLLGDYSRVPADSETVRHLRDHCGARGVTAANVAAAAAARYAPFGRYAFLRYWRELWVGYEAAFGDFRAVDPALYAQYTGSNMAKRRGGGGGRPAASVAGGARAAGAD
jgi:hypothetical protein